MHCCKLNNHESVCTNLQDRKNIVCGLQCALAVIAACGVALSISAIVSYLPSSAGYGGAAACICSLVTLAICTVCSPQDTLGHLPDSSETQKSSSQAKIGDEIGFEDFKQGQLRVGSQLLPNDIYNTIFAQLDAPDLARASLVCKHWHWLASNDLFWEQLCIQDIVPAPEGQILPSSDHQVIYRLAQTLNQKIRKVTPGARKNWTPISRARALLVAHNRIFLFSDSSKVEMWDSALQTRLFSKSVWDHYLPQFKLIGNTVYFIVSSRRGALRIFPFDFVDNNHKEKPRLYFEPGKKWNFFRQKIPFELGDGKAMVGHKDGSIEVVDLETEGEDWTWDRTQIDYAGESDWDDSDERAWDESFKHTQQIKIEHLENGEWKEIWMEKGVRERNLMQWRRDIHNRQKLIGHADEITALRTVGNYVLSSSKDGTIRQWDLSNSACIQTIQTEFEQGACLLQVAGHYIFGLESEEKKIIGLWDLKTGDYLRHMELTEKCDSFHIYGNLLFCLYNQPTTKTIEVFDLLTQESVKRFSHESKWEGSFVFENGILYLMDYDNLITWDFSNV